MASDDYIGSSPITYVPLEDRDVLTYGQWSHDPTHLSRTQGFDTYGPNDGGYV